MNNNVLTRIKMNKTSKIECSSVYINLDAIKNKTFTVYYVDEINLQICENQVTEHWMTYDNHLPEYRYRKIEDAEYYLECITKPCVWMFDFNIKSFGRELSNKWYPYRTGEDYPIDEIKCGNIEYQCLFKASRHDIDKYKFINLEQLLKLENGTLPNVSLSLLKEFKMLKIIGNNSEFVSSVNIDDINFSKYLI